MIEEILLAVELATELVVLSAAFVAVLEWLE